jgi:hypothetical protein
MEFCSGARRRIAAVHVPAAIEDAAALQLQPDLLEIFQGNMMALRDVMNSENFGIRHREMQDCLRGVLASCGNSHVKLIRR